MARHLGTDHTELTVTVAAGARSSSRACRTSTTSRLPIRSQIPTYLVSAMTRKHVTVALSGDGGDELFAGYNRYQLHATVLAALSLLPRAMRNAAAAALTMVRPDRWTSLASVAAGAPASAADRRQDAQDGRRARSSTMPTRSIGGWSAIGSRPSDAGRARAAEHHLRTRQSAQEFPDLLARMQFLDLVTYLPDDILTKVDRASMAVALEARVPLLDHRVVEFSWRLPRRRQDAQRQQQSGSCDRCCTGMFRETLIERPKMGFGIPLGRMAPRAIARLGRDPAERKPACAMRALLDHEVVRRFWQEHLDGSRNWQYLLWDVLMLEAWRERWA